MVSLDAAALDASGRPLELTVQGARCAGCMSKIERAVAELPGVAATRFNLTSGKLTVLAKKAQRPDLARVIEELDRLGYPAAVFEPNPLRTQAERESRNLLMALGVAAFGAGNVMMFSVPVWAGLFGQEFDSTTRTLMYWFSALVATPCALFAARPFFASAWRSLRRGRANMDVPISIGVALTIAISLSELIQGGEHAYFDAAVTLVFFLLIGRWLDLRLRQSAASAADSLLALQAPTARRLDARGAEFIVPVGDIVPGDLVAILPGDRVPVDGSVESGSGQVDNGLITGESLPCDIVPGARLQAGALNLSARLVLRARSRPEDSTVAALARLMEAGAQARSRYVVLADKAAALYVPIIHTLAVGAYLGGLVLGLESREALLRAVTVLIVTCPCALGLAAPAVQITASGRLFRRGVLVKSGAALERLAEVNHVIFDKTGVLTQGRPELVGAHYCQLALAAPLARASRHPLARAIADAAGSGPVANDVHETAGMGLVGKIDGRSARLGRADFVGRGDNPTETELWFEVEGREPIRFQFTDSLRADAAKAVADLQARGLTVEILSGDTARAVERVAIAVGAEQWRYGLTPQEKVGILEKRREAGWRVLMVGDGLNDAPALALAHASIAPGSAVEASQSAADLVFCGQSLSAVTAAIDVARDARRRTLENFGFSALYNVVAAPAAMLGLVNPLVAALAMSGSSMVVTLNALRMTFSAPDK